MRRPESTAGRDPVKTEQAACPYLGLPDDPSSRFSFATPAHRCHVKRKPSTIDLGHQGAFCLSSEFRACSRYIAPALAIDASAKPERTSDPEVAPPLVPAPAAVRPPLTSGDGRPTRDARSDTRARAPPARPAWT